MGFWKDVKHEWEIPFSGTPQEKANFMNDIMLGVSVVGCHFIARHFFDGEIVRLIAMAVMVIVLNKLYRIIRYNIHKR